jgi:hypothetical protein
MLTCLTINPGCARRRLTAGGFGSPPGPEEGSTRRLAALGAAALTALYLFARLGIYLH